jgi:hypothetical protein
VDVAAALGFAALGFFGARLLLFCPFAMFASYYQFRRSSSPAVARTGAGCIGIGTRRNCRKRAMTALLLARLEQPAPVFGAENAGCSAEL